ncbi:MAG: AEC family transporter [Oscillospiraceae bacterium]|nr:AEC family transporter [Oscillospiraceae bacterium]
MSYFLQNALIVLRQLMMLYLIVAVGVVAERLNWFPEKAAKRCAQLLMFVVAPCIIIRSFLVMEYSPEILRNLGIALLGGLLLHGTGMALTWHAFRGRKHPDTDPVLHYGSIYGNNGYMGLPLAQAMVGDIGVFYVSIVVLTFSMFAFTHGMFVMSGGAVRNPASGRNRVTKFEVKKLFLNPATIAVAIGFPLFLLRVPALVPAGAFEIFTWPIDTIASMNTPLAMLMFGTFLSRTNFNSLLRNKKVLLTGLIKLFITPSIVLTALLALRADRTLLHALMIPAAAPSANNTVVFAALHERDAGYAAQVVSLISLISIITMPTMIALALSLVG